MNFSNLPILPHPFSFLLSLDSSKHSALFSLAKHSARPSSLLPLHKSSFSSLFVGLSATPLSRSRYQGLFGNQRMSSISLIRGPELTGHNEVFSHMYFSLRSIIERTFGDYCEESDSIDLMMKNTKIMKLKDIMR